MYIYNVTINIEEDCYEEWLNWMMKEHIPEMIATKKFSKALISEVMVEEEMGGVTVSVQYTTDSKKTLEQYYAEDADTMRAKSNRFAGKFVAFRTELNIIGEYS